jgi:uncharacterized membrane protein
MAKNKIGKKILRVVLTTITIIALFFFVISIWASVYTFVYNNILFTMLVSGGILLLLLIFGVTSWKKVKKKIVDIFT